MKTYSCKFLRSSDGCHVNVHDKIIYIYITQLLTKLVNKGPSRASFQNRVIATVGKSRL